MTIEHFTQLISNLTKDLAGRPVDGDLGVWLNQHHSPDSESYQDLKAACLGGIKEGWMCAQEHGGIRFGRVIKAGPATHNFSVDVVVMDEVVGPHHSHPNGEIDLVIPLDDSALFDDHGAGWVVYEAGSAHCPTVSNGTAIVLYLLPDGAIQFTR
jgi:hypothetical protein